jgi:serine/threonine-protein kinase
MDPLIGVTVGGYQILEIVGQGGMATVCRAHQISMNRDVAIKILPPQFLHHAASLDRFKQEASIVARLEHRAIVPVHDYGEYQGMPYIVMRYMDGGSVDDMLAEGPIPPKRTLQILEQIAPALDYAHREDVLHRDLKPSNILLDANGDAYITDFGIARLLGVNTKQLTTSGVVGTPSYMSPEQAQGHALDGRSDVYALGVVLFEMLTGVRPFEGETPYSVAVKHVTEAPPSACGINPLLSRPVEQALFKALSKNRDMRYHTAIELTDALEAAIERPSEAALSMEGMIETEPSLNKALREGVARRGDDSSWVGLGQPAPLPVSGAPQHLQVMPVYGHSPSRSYAGPLVPPKRRKHGAKRSSWTTWAALALLVGGLLLALALSGAYYLVNSGDSSANTAIPDYNATAIFKLTATKQAILGGADSPSDTDILPILQPTPTIPPTNTSHATSVDPAAN